MPEGRKPDSAELGLSLLSLSASGSAHELRAAIHVALAWGDIEERDVSEALGLLDRVLAMLCRLTR